MKEYVDSDILSFLRAIYFGAYTNPYKAAATRAYLDMNRTIRFKGLPDEKRLSLREQVNKRIEIGIKEMKVSSQEEFDKWHKQMCHEIQQIYTSNGVAFTIGQSQKWLNMTIKYLYMLGADTFENTFDFFHIPIDNYVFDVVRKVLGIERPKVAWSRFESYDEQYMKYQLMIRERIDIAPLRWEFKYWLMEARNQGEKQ